MATKEAQEPKKGGKSEAACTHKNIQYSELKKGREQQRRDNNAMARDQADRNALKKWHAMKHFEKLGNAVKAADCRGKYEGSKANANGTGFEQKVAEDTNAKWTSIQFHCPDCGISGDLDVVTDKGVVKECKASGQAANEVQFNKNASAAIAIFGAGTPTHMAVPAAEVSDVQRRFAQDMKGKVQPH